MKLRTNLFLIIGGLLITLILAQWWILTHLKQELREEVSSTAFEVSRDTASAVILHQVKIRTEFRNEELKKQRWEWHNAHPGSNDSDVVLELKANNNTPTIKLIGPGLNESIVVSQKGLNKSFNGISSKMLLAMGALLLAALFLAAYFSHRLAKPLQELVKTAKHVGDGHLGEQVKGAALTGPKEVQTAIAEFNAMSEKLEQLEAHNRQLEKSQQLSELGEIARGFAHSLRNPLNTLGLATTELADDHLSSQKKQQLNAIVRRQIERIDSWIKSFMALSQEGTIASEVDISVIIDELVLELSTIKPEISWQLEINQKYSIKGLDQEIRTILQVLLENAMEASTEQGTIEVILEDDADYCYINILDDGCGIPLEIIDKLFVPQVTSKGNGSGMGLFIAKRLAESRYQGKLEVHNREQGGAEVLLTLSKQSPLLETNEEIL